MNENREQILSTTENEANASKNGNTEVGSLSKDAQDKDKTENNRVLTKENELNKGDETLSVSFKPDASAESTTPNENGENSRGTFLSGLQRKAKILGSQILGNSNELVTADELQKSTTTLTEETAEQWKGAAGIDKRINTEYNTYRRSTKTDASNYRRGPIPIENLPKSDRAQNQTTHGTIDCDEEVDINSSPSSRGLLVYFSRLGFSTDEEEEVDLKFVASLLAAGANVNHEDRYGQTVLHAAARDWHSDVARYLIEQGALVDKADKYGRTPLHLAAAVDHYEMVQYLVLNGANVDEKSLEGQTPLHFACKNSALNSIKILLKLGAQINVRDKLLRTPLFVAAEAGRSHAARMLLDSEAPAGVYDIYGTSAMACMIEKMPAVAYEALSQFYVDDKALRRKYYYLNQLEAEQNKKDKNKSFAKDALEMIVVYKETDLVMHPVIQKMINVKWNLFARKKSWIELLINIFYTLIWVILALLIPRDAKFHTPFGSKSWRIVLEVIFVILTIYFAIKELLTSRRMRHIDYQWRDWRVRNVENELEFCHPKWPDERNYLEMEINRVWGFRGTYSRNKGWSIYEWCCHGSVLAVLACELYYEMTPSSNVAFKLYTIILSISVMMVCMRLMKICRAFTFLSAFIVLLGHVLGATLRFAFLFFEFFIPYVCILWVIFGGEYNATEIEKKSPGSAEQFRTFDEIVYITWLMTVTADIPFSQMVLYQRLLASIIVGTYYALVSVVCVNLYIALMSETFTRVYENAEANASLQQALLVIFLERQMGPQESAKTRKHFAKKCSPLEQLEYGQQKGRPLNLETETTIILGNVNRRLRTVTEAVEDGPKQDKDVTKDISLSAMKELKVKSRSIRNNQENFVGEIKKSIDDVMKEQENLTKILSSIVSRAPQQARSGGGGGGKLRRTKSSQSIA